MFSALARGRGRQLHKRGLTAVLGSALVVVAVAPAAHAATRQVWVAAVPATWNAVPNLRDAIHGTAFDRADTVFPTVVYARYTRNWGKPLRKPRIPGPLNEFDVSPPDVIG